MSNDDRSSILETLGSIDRVLLEPDSWPTIIHQFAEGMNATGGLLIGLDSVGELPTSDGASDAMERFWKEGWQQHDFRRRAFPAFQKGKAAIDEDIVSADEYKTLPIVRGLLVDVKLPWWCGVGFNDGSEVHVLSFLRSHEQGIFERPDADFLETASARLTQVATLARLSEKRALASVTDAFASMLVAVAGFDIRGRIVGRNERFDKMMGAGVAIRSGKLSIKDERSAREYEAVAARLRWVAEEQRTACDPIVVRRERETPLLLTIVPISSLTGSIFGNAHMLVMLKPIEVERSFPEHRIAQAFSLTKTEARFVSVLMAGSTVSEAAVELGISFNTARVHLRSVFSKTGTGRQSELLRLVASIG